MYRCAMGQGRERSPSKRQQTKHDVAVVTFDLVLIGGATDRPVGSSSCGTPGFDTFNMLTVILLCLCVGKAVLWSEHQLISLPGGV